MNTVFLKELRENAKWALVIFVAALAKVYLQVRDAPPNLMFSMQQWTIWVAPIAGLLMGVVQSLFETRPDNWAFVVHRPVPRGQIFVAKCAAGLLLLYAALAVPMLLGAAWAARPGNLPMPFQGRMVLPVLTDAFAAGVYYFTGMVVTLRRARWYGTRLLPLGFAVAFGSVVYYLTPQFWQAVLIVLAGMSVAALAAWGAFAENGAPAGGASRPTRAALGTMVYPGAVAVGFFVVGLSQTFDSGPREWRYYQFDQSGNAVIVHQRLDRDERSWAVTDAAGRPLSQYAGVDFDDPANANVFLRFNTQLVDERSVPWPLTMLYIAKGFRSPTPGVVPLRAVAPPGVRLRSTALYNVPERVIDLYDPVTRVPIGTVGPGGFAPRHDPPAGRFPGRPLNLSFLTNMHVLAFDSAVYWIELDQRRVRQVFAPEAGEPVYSAAEVGPATGPLVVVATPARVHVLRPDGQALFSAPMALDPAKRVFSAGLLNNGHLMFRTFRVPGQGAEPERLFEYAPDGTLVRETQLPRVVNYHGTKRVETAMFAMLMPVAGRATIPLWILDDVLDLRIGEFPRMFHGFMFGSAVVSALLALLIARRCGLGTGKTIAWTAAAGLLGPAGVGVMLGVTEWPPRERCAACGSKRLVGRRLCTRCAAPLPPPPLDGREIFEPAGAWQAA
jgi:hypothetical protein